MYNAQLVKPVAPEISERQDDDNRLWTFQQLVGGSFKSWLRNAKECQPKRPQIGVIVSSADRQGNHRYMIDDIPQEKEFTAKTLRNLLKQDEANYKEGFVKKRGTSELRRVMAPNRELKFMQKRLLRHLYKTAPVAREAHGFTPKRGNWTAACDIAAAMKKGQRYLILTQDLRKAFDSIKEGQVRETLKKSGLKGFQLHVATRIATFGGILATGAPSSPYVLNLLFKEIDEKLGRWATQHGGIYRRYADDLTIALPTWRTRAAKEARELIRRLFAKLGIELHPKKTRIVRLGLDSPSAEIIGLAVQQQKATRPKRLRHRLRGIIRAARKKIISGNIEAAERLTQTAVGLASYFSGEYVAIREAKTRRLNKKRFSSA